jgi:hypothetical protein
VSAYAEAVADGIQDRLRLRLFEAIWTQERNMSSAYDVRRVVAALQIVRREGGTITPDGGPLTTAASDRARQWRQQWMALCEAALSEPALPAVIGPDGAVHVGPDGLRCLAGIVGPARRVRIRAAPARSATHVSRPEG